MVFACCRENFQTIVPFLLLDAQTDALQQIATLIGRDLNDMLDACVVDFYVHCLPVFAVEKTSNFRFKNELKQQAPVTLKAYNFLLDRLSHEVVTSAYFPQQ